MKNQLTATLAFCLALSLTATAQKTDSLPNAVTVSYNYHHFDQPNATHWHIGSLEYQRQTKAGTFLARANYANRLQQHGLQLEAEAYPVLSKKVYAYVGMGYSANRPVFPHWRSGASLFVSLPKAWEAEGGFRHLHFYQNIWMGTAGLSKYAGAWLLNFRSFISLEAPADNQSYFFSARRYFKNEKDYAWLQLGSGISPDETRNVLINSNYRLSSKSVMAGTKLSLNKRSQFMLSAVWAVNEWTADSHTNQLTFSAGVVQRF